MTRLLHGSALASLLLLATAGAATGHRSDPIPGRLVLTPPATFELELTIDLDSLATGRALGHGGEAARGELESLSEEDYRATEERLSQLLARRLRARIDGRLVELEIDFPDASRKDHTFGQRALLAGRGPQNAANLTLETSRSFPPLELEVVRGEQVETLTLPKGEASPPLTWSAPPEPAP